MSSPVKLYIYDLSNGLAGQLSLPLIGRQVDGIWHTSIVVFGKELFYGQGIHTTQPGKSHHGKPLRIVDLGETAIDEETFNDYLTAMREYYTADKYHLLDFNCNSFTDDCIGFLTGGSLPPYITSLPSDFLSTPLGAALRPTIDAMFAGLPENGTVPASAGPSTLRSVAPQATPAGPSLDGDVLILPPPSPAPPQATLPPSALPTLPAPDTPLAAPMRISTNPASFRSLLGSHRAVVAFFTSATCGPCRMIEPEFEELAKSKSRANGVGFAKFDLSTRLGGALAREYSVAATPTFIFFLDGRQTHELKGVNASELRTQVDLLIFEAFPPHAHTSLSLPVIEAISLEPILVKQPRPDLDIMFTRLAGFIDGATSWTGAITQAQVKQTLLKTVLPFLKASTATSAHQLQPPTFDHWPALTLILITNLQPSDLFPMADVWRIALLNASFATWVASKTVQDGPLQGFVDKALQAEDLPRNYLLTVLRMLANTFSNRVLAREVLLFARDGATTLLVDALSHKDASVRTAAATLGFNVAAYLQRLRVDKVRARDDSLGGEENEEWEQEIIVAVLHAIEQETSSEETVHRLVACLGLLLRLSPYVAQLTPLLEALGAQRVLKAKLESGGCGEGGVLKKEVRKLISEVADKLCPAA